MRDLREIAKLTGCTIEAVKIYFRLVDWGLSDRDASRVARGLEWLNLSTAFAEGLPWWLPRLNVELSLVSSLVFGVGYIARYFV